MLAELYIIISAINNKIDNIDNALKTMNNVNKSIRL